MRKFIQNYSILVFPALIGCAMLFLLSGLKISGGVLYVAMWGTIGTLIVLVPMLRLSRRRNRLIRLLFGFIAIIMFYVLTFTLHAIITEVIPSFTDPEYVKVGKISNLIFNGSLVCLITFFPANIAVVLAFLLNDIYAKKIGKIICNKKEVEDEI